MIEANEFALTTHEQSKLIATSLHELLCRDHPCSWKTEKSWLGPKRLKYLSMATHVLEVIPFEKALKVFTSLKHYYKEEE